MKKPRSASSHRYSLWEGSPQCPPCSHPQPPSPGRQCYSASTGGTALSPSYMGGTPGPWVHLPHPAYQALPPTPAPIPHPGLLLGKHLCDPCSWEKPETAAGVDTSGTPAAKTTPACLCWRTQSVLSPSVRAGDCCSTRLWVSATTRLIVIVDTDGAQFCSLSSFFLRVNIPHLQI